MSYYLFENKNTCLSKIIFSVRSKTLNIKEYQQWLYENDLCVACGLEIETMDHFMTCPQYENEPYKDWCKINGNETHILNEVGLAIKKRFEERETMLDKIEAGWALDSNSIAPGDC